MTKPIEVCHAAVGLRVRHMRELLDLSQEELAKRAGISRGSLANIETGRQRLLLDNVEDLAKAIGTTPKALLKGVWW